jgi:APA family basic amino acid/polyamine antiporter
LGFLCLTAVFADLGGTYPVSGGPQAFVRRAFGDFAGLQVSFLYWVSGVTTNTAMVTAAVGYLAVFAPAVAEPLTAFAVAQLLLWSFTLVNLRGVRVGGTVQVATTVLKILPLLLLALPLLQRASLANAVPFAPHGYGALLPSIALVAWLFQGSEAVTVPGEEVKGAGMTIRRSAYMGFLLAAAVYMLVSVALTFGLPAAAIAGSPSPLAAAALLVMGPVGETVVTLGALVSILGCLNGWILVSGRLPFAAARDGFGPVWLGRIHPRFGTPDASLLVSSAAAAALTCLYFNETLLQAYNFIVLLSTDTALVAVGATCVAQLALLRREPQRFTPAQRRRAPLTAWAGLAVITLMVIGAGWWVGFLTVSSLTLPTAYFLRVRSIKR